MACPGYVPGVSAASEMSKTHPVGVVHVIVTLNRAGVHRTGPGCVEQGRGASNGAGVCRTGPGCIEWGRCASNGARVRRTGLGCIERGRGASNGARVRQTGLERVASGQEHMERGQWGAGRPWIAAWAQGCITGDGMGSQTHVWMRLRACRVGQGLGYTGWARACVWVLVAV